MSDERGSLSYDRPASFHRVPHKQFVVRCVSSSITPFQQGYA
jgi:hypothetical protein